MSNFKLKFSTKFKKDFKKIALDKNKLLATRNVFDLLMEFGTGGIPPEMKPHKLTGNYKDNWECHVKPDLLLIWFQVDIPNKQIQLVRIGSHSDLFK